MLVQNRCKVVQSSANWCKTLQLGRRTVEWKKTLEIGRVWSNLVERSRMTGFDGGVKARPSRSLALGHVWEGLAVYSDKGLHYSAGLSSSGKSGSATASQGGVCRTQRVSSLFQVVSSAAIRSLFGQLTCPCLAAATHEFGTGRRILCRIS